MLKNAFSPKTTRRWLISGIGVSLMGSLTGQALAGGGGREPEPRSSSSTKEINNKTPKTKAKKLNVIYTQQNLRKIKDKDLKTAIRGNKEGHNIVIEGYSKRMSSVIFELMLLDRDRTLAIVAQLGATEKREYRKSVLFRAYTSAKTDFDELDQGVIGILFENDPEVVKAKRWRDLIKTWYSRPMDGTKKQKVTN